MEQKKHENEIKRFMKSLGIYKKEFNRTISICAAMLKNLDELEQHFFDSGNEYIVEHTNKNGNTNTQKNPEYQCIESLRRDILVYLRELGITPQGLKRYNEKLTASEKKKEDAGLEKVLKMFGT